MNQFLNAIINQGTLSVLMGATPLVAPFMAIFDSSKTKQDVKFMWAMFTPLAIIGLGVIASLKMV